MYEIIRTEASTAFFVEHREVEKGLSAGRRRRMAQGFLTPADAGLFRRRIFSDLAQCCAT